MTGEVCLRSPSVEHLLRAVPSFLGAAMRITLRVLGLDLFDLTVTTDDAPDDTEDQTTPVTFGFHGSGAGVIERQADETSEYDGYDKR